MLWKSARHSQVVVAPGKLFRTPMQRISWPCDGQEAMGPTVGNLQAYLVACNVAGNREGDKVIVYTRRDAKADASSSPNGAPAPQIVGGSGKKDS